MAEPFQMLRVRGEPRPPTSDAHWGHEPGRAALLRRLWAEPAQQRSPPRFRQRFMGRSRGLRNEPHISCIRFKQVPLPGWPRCCSNSCRTEAELERRNLRFASAHVGGYEILEGLPPWTRGNRREVPSAGLGTHPPATSVRRHNAALDRQRRPGVVAVGQRRTTPRSANSPGELAIS